MGKLLPDSRVSQSSAGFHGGSSRAQASDEAEQEVTSGTTAPDPYAVDESDTAALIQGAKGAAAEELAASQGNCCDCAPSGGWREGLKAT